MEGENFLKVVYVVVGQYKYMYIYKSNEWMNMLPSLNSAKIQFKKEKVNLIRY